MNNINQRFGNPQGGLQQGQPRGQWQGQAQGNAYHQNNMEFPQSQNHAVIGLTNNFQNVQPAYGNSPAQRFQNPNMQHPIVAPGTQESIKKQQFEEQQRKLKEISSRGVRAKPKDGKHLVDDFLSKNDLNLSAGLKMMPKSFNPQSNPGGARSQHQHHDGGFQSTFPASAELQTPAQFPQPVFSHAQLPPLGTRSSTLQSSISTQEFQSAPSSFSDPGMFKQSSFQEDDFGDFQAGSSNMSSATAQEIKSFKSLPELKSSQTANALLVDDKPNFMASGMPANKTPKHADAFDASFLNLASQITGKSFDSGSLASSSSTSLFSSVQGIVEPQFSTTNYQGSNSGPGSVNQPGSDMKRIPDMNQASSQGFQQLQQGKNPHQQMQLEYRQQPKYGKEQHHDQPQHNADPGTEPASFQNNLPENEDPNSPEKLYGSTLPAWCTDVEHLPTVYKKILEKSLALDGSIDTGKLHSLLLASNVAKDKLGVIWEMANRRTPGILVEEELFIVLGLIALAQAGWSKLSISKLVSCNTAPIPEFPEYLFIDTEKESVFGGESIIADDWSSNRSESPVDPNDKYSVFKSFEKARSASIGSLERQLSNSSKDNTEWGHSGTLRDETVLSVGHAVLPIQENTEIEADWANFKSADQGVAMPSSIPPLPLSTNTSKKSDFAKPIQGFTDIVPSSSVLPTIPSNTEFSVNLQSFAATFPASSVPPTLPSNTDDVPSSGQSFAAPFPASSAPPMLPSNTNDVPSSGQSFAAFFPASSAPPMLPSNTNDVPAPAQSFAATFPVFSALPIIPSNTNDVPVPKKNFTAAIPSSSMAPNKMIEFPGTPRNLKEAIPPSTLPTTNAGVPSEFSAPSQMSTSVDTKSFASFPSQTTNTSHFSSFENDLNLNSKPNYEAFSEHFPMPHKQQDDLTGSPEVDDFGDFQAVQGNNEFKDISDLNHPEQFYHFNTETGKDDKFSKHENSPELSAMASLNTAPISTAQGDSQSNAMDDSWDDFASFSQPTAVNTETNASTNPAFNKASISNDDSNHPSIPGINCDFPVQNHDISLDGNLSLANSKVAGTSESNNITKKPANESIFGVERPKFSTNKDTITEKTIDIFGQKSGDIFCQSQPNNTDFAEFGTDDSLKGTETAYQDTSFDLFHPKASESRREATEHAPFDGKNHAATEEFTSSSSKELSEKTNQLKSNMDILQSRNPGLNPSKTDDILQFSSKFPDKHGNFNDGHVVNRDALLGSFAKPLSVNETEKIIANKKSEPKKVLIEEKKERAESVVDAESRYKALSGVIEESDRHVHEWKRCLTSIRNVLSSTASTIKASKVSLQSKQEIFESEKGREYFSALKEIFAVMCRVKISINDSAFARTSEEIKSCVQQVDVLWREICTFSSGLPQYALPDSAKLLQPTHTDDSSMNSLCGLCLLNVNIQSIELNGFTISSATLTYGGRTYHSTCANFWCNKVNPVLPSLPPLSSGLL